MSEQAPEPRAPGGRAGGAARRPVLGVPLWGWGVILGAGLGAIILVRRLRGGSSTATTQGVSSAQVPSDQQIGLTEYEQISSQLTGIEGTDQALLAAIKDLQGADSDKGGGGPGGGGGGDNDGGGESDQEEDRESPRQERREERPEKPKPPKGRQRHVPPRKPPARPRKPPRRVTVPPANPPPRGR